MDAKAFGVGLRNCRSVGSGKGKGKARVTAIEDNTKMEAYPPVPPRPPPQQNNGTKACGRLGLSTAPLTVTNSSPVAASGGAARGAVVGAGTGIRAELGSRGVGRNNGGSKHIGRGGVIPDPRECRKRKLSWEKGSSGHGSTTGDPGGEKRSCSVDSNHPCNEGGGERVGINADSGDLEDRSSSHKCPGGDTSYSTHDNGRRKAPGSGWGVAGAGQNGQLPVNFSLHARKRAVLRGLDKIFQMSWSEDNFSLFGNDMMQCFYDVANMTGEPVRARALMYVEQLAHRWKYAHMHVGWKKAARPTPEEVLDAIIAMHCLERVGIHHEIKSEVQSSLKMYTARDYLGWDPADGPPPEEVADMYTGEAIGRYRCMSNSIINTYYADRVGLQLGCSFEQVLRWLPEFWPYKGPLDLDWENYIDQCYLVTHVVLTLNNLGELRLDPELFPHEFLFMREHLAVQIKQRDMHLVGAFVSCLRCFGAPDSDTLIQAGISFLLEAQEEDGSWDRGEDRDDYTTYHATMFGIQALLTHHYRGCGPGTTGVVPLLEEWYKEETARKPGERRKAWAGLGGSDGGRPEESKAAGASEGSKAGASWQGSQLPSMCRPSSDSDDTGGEDSSNRDQHSPGKEGGEEAALRFAKAVASTMTDTVEAGRWDTVKQQLRDLRKAQVTLEVLKSSDIGRTVRHLRKSEEPDVASLASDLVARWRKLALAGQFVRSEDSK